MAGVAGLEPTNDGTKTRCLANLAIPLQNRLKLLMQSWHVVKNFLAVF